MGARAAPVRTRVTIFSLLIGHMEGPRGFDPQRHTVRIASCLLTPATCLGRMRRTHWHLSAFGKAPGDSCCTVHRPPRAGSCRRDLSQPMGHTILHTTQVWTMERPGVRRARRPLTGFTIVADQLHALGTANQRQVHVVRRGSRIAGEEYSPAEGHARLEAKLPHSSRRHGAEHSLVVVQLKDIHGAIAVLIQVEFTTGDHIKGRQRQRLVMQFLPRVGGGAVDGVHRLGVQQHRVGVQERAWPDV
eukprot:2922264-Prymnesium_polylepis.2